MRKIQNLKELIKIRSELRIDGKKVVFTNGCFDIIHRGHIHLFREARKQGDVLVVAVNDDASVKDLKGALRPIFPLEERLEMLEAVEEIDYLISFSEKTPQKIIASLIPDILVKGGDWKRDEVVGKQIVEKAGGKVIIIPYIKTYSSSRVIKKIIKSAHLKKKGEKRRIE